MLKEHIYLGQQEAIEHLEYLIASHQEENFFLPFTLIKVLAPDNLQGRENKNCTFKIKAVTENDESREM